jgi:hypothetical protein
VPTRRIGIACAAPHCAASPAPDESQRALADALGMHAPRLVARQSTTTSGRSSRQSCGAWLMIKASPRECIPDIGAWADDVAALLVAGLAEQRELVRHARIAPRLDDQRVVAR